MPRAVSALLGLLVVCPASAFALEVPPLEGRVSDRAELLDEGVERRLEQRLEAYERETGHQFALLTMPTLEGDPIEDFSIRVVEEWKLGREDKDDGLLMLVVPQDRAMRIEVGYGLEGDIPDITAGRIVRNVMAPRFRKLDYEGGISKAFEMLMQAGRGEAVEPPPAEPARERSATRHGGRRRGGGSFFLLAILFFFVMPMFGGRRGRRLGGFFFLGGLGSGLGGGFRGGGLGGGGLGGGGFSGGGGGFGGGGASGSW